MKCNFPVSFTAKKRYAGTIRFLSLMLIILLTSLGVKAQVVISQVYGGGGSTTGTPSFKHDYIELFNPTASPVNLTGWSVQYASSGGTSWQKTDLSGTIQPYSYFLVKQGSATGALGADLPTADVSTGNISMSASMGKVALMSTNTLIASGVSCPVGAPGYADFVGYGSANCFEGTGPTAGINNTTAVFRKNNGCTDTNNNNADFATGTPVPRNSGSAINTCGTSCAAPSAQPSLLNLTPSINSISGSFTASGAGDNYLVLRSTSNSLNQQPVNGTSYSDGQTLGNAVVVASGNNTSFTTSGLQAATTYYFFIYAYNSTGNCYNLNSPLTGSVTTSTQSTVSVAAGVHAAEPSTNGSFTVNLSQPAPAGGVTVTYTLGGTATRGVDYNDPANGSITVAAGSSTATIAINVIDDAVFEGVETITITLTGANAGFVLGTATATINLNDNETASTKVVINQVYGGGGNSGATFKNDFIELYNTENVPVNLSGWSVQYSGATSTGNWTVTPLTGIIPPHGFYLIQQAAGSGGTVNLPPYDDIGGITMSATTGKVALVKSTTPLSGANPTSSLIVDKVGYGINANGYETAPAPGTENATAIKRIVDGVDTDNNAADFELVTPEPRNKTYTTSPPALVSVTPADNSTNVPYNVPTSITFDKPVQKGTGFITVYENGTPHAIDVNSAAVIVSGRTVTINTTYAPGKSYYINIDATALKDAYNNYFPGIANTTSWNFTSYNSAVAVTLPASFDFQNCTGTGLLPHGFTQYSETGSVVWDCTPFGRDPNAPAGTAQYPNGVQINGYVGGTNVPNVDWLISPAIDLRGTNYPLLSFWSRTAFNGEPLQLKISTDYSGTGDPANATWVDINGKFPALASNVWTLSSDINLSAFKAARVYIAFVYTSSDDDGARWTIDDISIINSQVPPPPSLTVITTDVQFGYVAQGGAGVKTLSFIGNDLTQEVTLTAAGDFQLSKDGISFSPSIVYSVEEANNIFKSVYVKFSPSVAEENFTGQVTVTTGDLNGTITLKGTSIDPETTLEVVNWNIEWFGSLAEGPKNEALQEQNVLTIFNNVGADIYGLTEIVDESKLASVVSKMDGYSYVISNYGSHTNPYSSTPGPLAQAQKLAFVYKTSVFSNVTATPLLSQGINTPEDVRNPAYNWWASGRFPYMMNADMTLNGVTRNIKFVLVHAKANTSPTNTSYERRKRGADTLSYTLKQLYPDDNIIILGDFNDDLDQSITAGFTTTSYSSFTTDPSNFFSPTLSLSLAGKKSTVKYNDMIDHVMVSNEMQPYYMPGTATVLTDVTSLVNSYGTTTSDHYPVFTRYMFCRVICPANIVVTADKGACGAVVNFNVASTMNCSGVIAAPASGSFFPIGTTTVTVTSSTGETCTFTVTVKDEEAPAITAPANVRVNAAAGLCNIAKTDVTLGAPQYSDNCTGVTVTNDAPETFPVGTTTVTWTATDAAGNTATATQTVTVVDNQQPVITCPTVPVQCFNANGTYTIQPLTATDNCGIQSVSYAITGATNRSGNGYNASGLYAEGTSIITWTVTDVNGNTATCQSTVVVNPAVTSSVADVFAVTPGGLANTLYIGYGPASLTLDAIASGGTAPYSYQWTIGSASGPVQNSNASYTVSPTTNTTYYLSVVDAYGCNAPVISKSILVEDVRCGEKLDKVAICKNTDGKRITLCVAQESVAVHLANGAFLKGCDNASSASAEIQSSEKVTGELSWTVTATPNPSNSSFTLRIVSGRTSEYVSMRVMDALGRVVETRNNIAANTQLNIGADYRPGIYIVELVQANNKKQIKLVKAKN